MSTRNPMNQRYTSDSIEGNSRKSMSRAKPVRKAAETVHIKSEPVTKKEKQKAALAKDKAQRKVDNERLAAAGEPNNPLYKIYRRWWWALLIAAIVFTVISWLLQSYQIEPRWLSYVAIGLAYLFIILALVVDFKLIRPIRKEYQAAVLKPISKTQQKKIDKQAAAIDAANAAAREQAAAQKKAKRATLFGMGKKDTRVDGAPEVADTVAEAKDATKGKDATQAAAKGATAKAADAHSNSGKEK